MEEYSPIPFVYLAAGISSRFGGKIKALAPVGPNGKPFLAVSMDQAILAGFGRFVLIVSDKTVGPLRAVFGDSYQGIPITYTMQETPSYRARPFGTAHAVLSVRGIVDGPFGLGSSDDLFGEETYRIVIDHLTDGTLVVPGYPLKNVVPLQGGVNRAILEHQGNHLVKIAEHFNIEKGDIGKKYTGEEYSAMLIYGLNTNVLDHIQEQFKDFLKQHPHDISTEMLLPNILNEIVTQKISEIMVIPTQDVPVSLTFPEDEEVVRATLAERGV